MNKLRIYLKDFFVLIPANELLPTMQLLTNTFLHHRCFLKSLFSSGGIITMNTNVESTDLFILDIHRRMINQQDPLKSLKMIKEKLSL